MRRAAALLAVLAVLTGCTTSYRHMSDPRVANDGYDLLCGGIEKGERLTVSVDLCKNFAPNKGEFVLVDIKYRWSHGK